jgi:hypothetical protein
VKTICWRGSDLPDNVAAGARALRAWNAALLAVLVGLSALAALTGAFFLPLWWNGLPFPVSALLCGALNVAIMLTATWAVPRAGLVPLLVWLLVCLACLMPGPRGGGNVLSAIPDWRVPFYLALGALPAALARRLVRRE